MDIEFFRVYCLAKKGVVACFPFDDKTLVFKVLDKMFALTNLERFPFGVNLKCDPKKALELRELYPESIFPGYHMNKKHWNTIYFEAHHTDEFLKKAIDESYRLVVATFTKKRQQELAAM